MATRWIIGLASSTGYGPADIEGAHAALMELRGVGHHVRVAQLHGVRQPYSPELCELIRRVRGLATCEVHQVSRLHRLLGETFASAARAVADSANLSLQKVQAIGCPGHVVGQNLEGRFGATLLLGMPAVIAERCGVTVVSDFRYRDLAAGGQGGPLAALPDYYLFHQPREHRLLIHLGGIARLVFLPANGGPQDVVAYEAGPCNVLLDALVRQLTGGREAYDAGGKHAVQGRCLEPLLQNWLAHPALQRRPPRSLPRHTFADEFATLAVHDLRQHDGGGLHDLLCTATHFVARSIVSALRFLPIPVPPRPAQPFRVLLSGGGVRNGLLWHLLQQQLPDVPLSRTDEVGIPAELRKSVIPGLLAALTLDGVSGNLPSATGAAGPRLLGSLTPGGSSNWARCLNWMAQHVGAPLPIGA
jgi:anhydro-N-acetylmuramic acid kinase